MSLSDRVARALLLATSIGYICRAARLRRCMTLAELSAKTGIHERTLRTLERGEGVHQTIDLMADVAWALGFEWEFRLRDGSNQYSASGMEAPSGGETGTGSTEGDSPTLEEGTPK